ncbi:MAG: AbrB/MazE/SpoVT family DNA-binding domain-containing protein [Deltaproteobacteria bacterium]|nr:AbrB/MazE/SpoVT family DNA-binding domain-containing protein [Deltaproteobacteria bacterium]
MVRVRALLEAGGRVVLPEECLQALGLQPGDEVMLEVDGGRIAIVPAQDALRRAQDLVRQYVPAGRSLSEELIAERRDEARRG